MEPVQIRDDVDPNSPEYRRSLIKFTFIVLALMFFGGTCLGLKISNAERHGAGIDAPTQTVD